MKSMKRLRNVFGITILLMKDRCQYLFFVCFRARARITSHVWASIHPVWRRCSSFPYEEYAQSSRLARQASQHPNRESYSCANPYRILSGLVKKANIENVEKSRQPSPRLRQTCQRRSLPSRVRAVAATTRKRAARLPFCRAHVLHVLRTSKWLRPFFR